MVNGTKKLVKAVKIKKDISPHTARHFSGKASWNLIFPQLLQGIY